MATMNISLPDKLRAIVEARVSTGLFANASDYVRALIRRDEEAEAKKIRLLTVLEKAESEIAGGDAIELSTDEDIANYFKILRQRAKEQ